MEGGKHRFQKCPSGIRRIVIVDRVFHRLKTAFSDWLREIAVEALPHALQNTVVIRTPSRAPVATADNPAVGMTGAKGGRTPIAPGLKNWLQIGSVGAGL